MTEKKKTHRHRAKKPKAISAGKAVAGNNDLLTEIFLRLPVKFLVRFKLVSKQWCRFISSPEFSKLYINNALQKNPNSLFSPSGIYFYYPFSLDGPRRVDAVSLFNTSIPPVSRKKKIFGARFGSTFKVLKSCNGLLLCSFTKKCSTYDVEVVVFNPTTGTANILPPWHSNDPLQMRSNVGFFLVYDPSISHYHKVICIKKLPAPALSCEVFIYTSETNLWRKSSCRFDMEWNMQRLSSGLYWNHGIHWFGKRYSLHFDVDSEKTTERKMPALPYRGLSLRRIRYIGEWCGHLHLIQIANASAKVFYVLEFDKDTFEWFFKYRVHLTHIISAFPEVVRYRKCSKLWYNFNILAVVRGDKEEDSELVLAIPGKVISFNFVRKTVKLLRDMPEKAGKSLLIDYDCSYPYLETLCHCGSIQSE